MQIIKLSNHNKTPDTSDICLTTGILASYLKVNYDSNDLNNYHRVIDEKRMIEHIVDDLNKYICKPLSFDGYIISGGYISSIFERQYMGDNGVITNYASIISNDIDIFIIADNNTKRNLILKDLLQSFKYEFIVRSSHCISLYTGNHDRFIQIVICQINSIVELFHTFDIDVCKMYYNGQGIYGTFEAFNEFKTGIIRYNHYNVSANYDFRLCKYHEYKKFDIYFPFLLYAYLMQILNKNEVGGLKMILQGPGDVKEYEYLETYSHGCDYNVKTINDLFTIIRQQFRINCFDTKVGRKEDLLQVLSGKQPDNILREWYISDYEYIKTYIYNLGGFIKRNYGSTLRKCLNNEQYEKFITKMLGTNLLPPFSFSCKDIRKRIVSKTPKKYKNGYY